MIPGVLTNDEVKIVDSTGTNTADVNADGQLHVVLAGMVDATNSSTALLGGGATFTGTASEVLDYGFIFVTVYSDVASAASGLSLEQSSDGTNWDNKDTYTIAAATGKTYSVQPSARYFRVVYTNGGAGQAVFRLQTVFKKTSSLASSHRLGDNLSADDDASLQIAIIKGQNPGGAYVDFDATTAGNFKVSLEELESGISSNSNAQLNVTQFDAAGNELFNAAANAGYVYLTDGTNTMPTMDVVGRAGYVTLTNGTISPDIVAHEGQTSIRTIQGHQEEFIIHLDAENISATTGFMLIDLSDTTNWPHTNTGHIIVNAVCFSVNPSSAFSGEIDIGFLTDVDADNGDFNQILTIHNTQTASVSVTNQFRFENGLDLELTEWFGPTAANDTTWQTDVNLQGPDDASSYPSGTGDMVMKITRTAGNVDVGITVTYTTVA